MDIRVLRYFLSVCEHGTMSRAAEALHVTQPALSRQIAQLERELGTTLLVRGARRVELTEKGLYLRRRAQEIVDLADQTTSDLAHGEDIVEGDVFIGAGESEGLRVIARHVHAFREKYPGVRFHLHSGNAPDLIERLEHGVDDFSVLMSYPDVDRYAHLRLSPTDAWGVLMRDDDPLVAREAVSPADLLDAPLVVPERHAKGDRLTGLLATWFGERAGEVNIAATYNLSYNGALLVQESVGRMISFDGLTTVGPGTGLEFRLLFPPLVSVIDLAWKRDVPLGDIARRFLELIREDDSTALGVRQRNRSESEYAKEMDDRYRSMHDGNETEHDLVEV